MAEKRLLEIVDRSDQVRRVFVRSNDTLDKAQPSDKGRGVGRGSSEDQLQQSKADTRSAAAAITKVIYEAATSLRPARSMWYRRTRDISCCIETAGRVSDLPVFTSQAPLPVS